jgi:hypothetical protein
VKMDIYFVQFVNAVWKSPVRFLPFEDRVVHDCRILNSDSNLGEKQKNKHKIG